MIKKIIKKMENSKYSPYIVILILAILISIPLFTMNLSEYNEFRIHIIRITAIKEILSKGVFPPNINAKYMCGFGYALNIFYGPITTFIPIFISIFTKSTSLALKIFTFLTVLFSGVTMYQFIKKITKRKLPSLIGALIYMSAPYKFTDIYSRNALGEYTAFVFIPIAFNGIYELINGNYKKHYLIVLGFVGLILSHTITTIYTAIFAFIYLIINIKKLKNIEIWKCLIIDAFLIIASTSFYTVPLLEHKMYGNYSIYNETAMGTSAETVYENTNTISDWFTCELSKQELVFSFGLVITFLSIAIVFCYKRVEKKYIKEYFEFGVFAIASLILCTKIFPWKAMPQILTVTQFAWRLNGFFIFFISIVCGINAMIITEILSKIKFVIVIILIMVISLLSTLRGLNYWSNYNSSIDYNYENALIELEKLGPYNVNREYLPLNAFKNIDYINSRESRTYVINGYANIESESKDLLNDSLEITDVSNAELELPYIYYQGYTVKLNDEVISNYESNKGFLCIKTNENGKITVEYTGTVAEKIGYCISGLGIIMILVSIIINRAKKHILLKNFRNYSKI